MTRKCTYITSLHDTERTLLPYKSLHDYPNENLTSLLEMHRIYITRYSTGLVPTHLGSSLERVRTPQHYTTKQFRELVVGCLTHNSDKSL